MNNDILLDFKFSSAQKNMYNLLCNFKWNLSGKVFSSLTVLFCRLLYFSPACHEHIYTYIKFSRISRKTIFSYMGKLDLEIKCNGVWHVIFKIWKNILVTVHLYIVMFAYTNTKSSYVDKSVIIYIRNIS